MNDKNDMNDKKDNAARSLATSHSEVEESICKIVRLRSANEDEDSEPIKLLEVNVDTVVAGIVPVTFGPGEDVPYPSIVVEVTPDELDRIEKGELELPPEWQMGEVLVEKTPQGL